MKYEMKLKDIYFDLIKSGKKIYEGRLNDEKRQLLCVGDTLIFKKEPELDEIIEVSITDLIYFDSFEKMTKNLSLEKLGFENTTPQKVADVYHQFYSFDDEKKYGVVAIKVEIKK